MMPAQAVGDLPTGAPERTVLKVLSTRILPDLCLMEFPLFPLYVFSDGNRPEYSETEIAWYIPRWNVRIYFLYQDPSAPDCSPSKNLRGHAHVASPWPDVLLWTGGWNLRTHTSVPAANADWRFPWQEMRLDDMRVRYMSLHVRWAGGWTRCRVHVVFPTTTQICAPENLLLPGVYESRIGQASCPPRNMDPLPSMYVWFPYVPLWDT